MSGIVGIYYLDGRPVDRSEIQDMLNTISHRGPDGSGIWTDGSIGFGHAMLHTTPESLHEKLPLTNQRGDLTITADARIDNREELFRALDFNGRPRETIPDSEVILAAYEKWGERCPEKLLGDFAFAILDNKKRVLFCARDHFGVKPFYYFQSEKLFAFASEIKSLLCLPDVPHKLNEVAVADYLALLVEDKVNTFYKEILRLPPGHRMTMGNGKISIHSYWSLNPSRHVNLKTGDEYAGAFRDLFEGAVRCRLRTAFPVGSMLSGGLDSSSIVCMARQLLSRNGGESLHTFSAIFEDVPECDEQTYINTVISKGGIQAHFMRADKISPLANLEDIFRHQESPVLGANLFMYWGLYRAAREKGVRIILDGDDGDTTVSHGFAYLTELARAGKWISLSKEAKELSKRLNIPCRKVLWRRGIMPLIPESVRKVRRMIRAGKELLWECNNIINPDFARRIGLQNRIREERGLSGSLRTERDDHRHALSSGLITEGLEMIDRTAAAFRLEPRYPFYDKQLAEFCLALPPEQKLYRGWTRIVMRRAMTDILPKEIQWRAGKTSLSPNFIRSLITFERERLENTVNDSAAIVPYVNLRAFRKIFQQFVKKNSSGDAFTVWTGLTLSLWLAQADLRP